MRRRGPFFSDLGEQPGLGRGGRPVLFRMIVGQAPGLQDDGAKFGNAAATRVIKVHKRKAGPGHRMLQERDRRRPWEAILAAQMQKSADQAMAAVSVVITAARPVAVVGKMLEHQVEQLHRLRDLGFRMGLSAPDPGNGRTVSRAASIGSAGAHGRLIGSTKFGSLFFTLPTRGLTGQQPMRSGRVGGEQGLQMRLVRRFLAEPCRPGLGRNRRRPAAAPHPRCTD
jgi:hypothetical protein